MAREAQSNGSMAKISGVNGNSLGPQKVLTEKPERFTCLDAAFKNNDQLKTNTALQMESANLSAYGGD